MKPSNLDPDEVAKFNAAAPRWWDPNGEMKPLHDINPLRVNFIDERTKLRGKTVLDIGCGGGVLSEGMAKRGACVTGIDASDNVIAVAKLHLLESGQSVQYYRVMAEEFAEQHAGQFDVVTCMEMLEHVPDPASVIAACAKLVKPGGHLFLSTLNRNLKSFLLAIVGAEYLAGMLPKGTHHYEKFICPAELDSWLRTNGLKMQEMKGLSYNPLLQRYSLGSDIDVNYLAFAIKEIL